MAEHAAWLYSNCHEGKDGKTAIERAQGVRTPMPLACFGEKVHFKPLEGSSVGRTDNLEAKWDDGIWLGVESRTGENRIGTESGIVKCRSVRRKPEEERWSATALKALTGAPWDPSPGNATQQGDTVAKPLGQESADIEPKEESNQPGRLARRTRLVKEDFLEHGYTQGCPGCRQIRLGLDYRGHSELCRQRMENTHCYHR